MAVREALVGWLLLILGLAASVAATVFADGLVRTLLVSAAALWMICVIFAVFMGLKSAMPRLRVFALGGVFWLFLLFFMTLADVLTR